MAKNFAEIAFSQTVKAIQEKMGSRANYARMEKSVRFDGLTEYEIDFIAERDSFYMASIGENGYPYIQHRGGPKGFVKVLDSKRLGFIDFKGNMQYISVGNITQQNHVSLIMMDYAGRTRLKLFAKAELVELNENPALLKSLSLDGYKARPERMMILHVEAYDWNCPQHITQRFTIEQVEQAFASQREYVAELEAEISQLKKQLNQQNV